MNNKRYRLIEIRNNKGFTHQKMADSLGISRSFYTMIENGTRNPSLKLAKKIAEVLQVDIDDIFFTKPSNEKLQSNKTA